MKKQCQTCHQFVSVAHQCPSRAEFCQDCGIDATTLAGASRRLKAGRCIPCYHKARRRHFAPLCSHCGGAGYLAVERSA